MSKLNRPKESEIEQMIVVLGGSGYVGSAIVAQLQQRGLPHVSVSRRVCNYTVPEKLSELLAAVRPEFLINAAGYTGKPNVDACEVAKAECVAGNALLPGIVRDCCEKSGTPWGHVSSGCIYTGCREDGTGFREDDNPNFSFRQNNCSFYSGCKALGEELLQGAKDCFIWRLRIPFDERDGERNYLSKLLRYERLLEAENSLSNLQDFAAACVDCWSRKLNYGIYNLVNPGVVSTSQVTQELLNCRVTTKNFQFFESEEVFMKAAAKTPRSNCILDSTKALEAGLMKTPVLESIRIALSRWKTVDT